MRLPFRRSRKRASGKGSSKGTSKQTSWAFASAIDTLRKGSRHRRVLDFGAACGDNVEFFSGVGCQLEILDLYPQLVERPDRLARTHESSAIQHLIDQILDQRPGKTDEPRAFNLLLTWDLFDFLSPEQVRGLMAGMEPYVSVGSILMAQVSYLGTVPEAPRQIKIQDQETLLVTEAEGCRSSPRYTEHQLLKVMPGWEVDQCFLQRSGLREYLFRRG